MTSTLPLMGCGASSPFTPFNPASITGLKMWFKGDGTVLNGSGTQAVNNDPVGTWTDESGTGNTITQSTAAKRPLFKTASQNGLPGVLFDGVDDFMIKVSPTGVLVSTQTYFFVGTLFSTGTQQYVSCSGFQTGVGRGFVIRKTNDDLKHVTLENIADVATSTNTWTAATGVIQETVTHGVVTDNAKMYLNGANETAGGNTNATFTALGDFTMGSDNSGTFGNIFLLMYEYLMYDNVLSGVNQLAVESYLKTKWGTP